MFIDNNIPKSASSSFVIFAISVLKLDACRSYRGAGSSGNFRKGEISGRLLTYVGVTSFKRQLPQCSLMGGTLKNFLLWRALAMIQ